MAANESYVVLANARLEVVNQDTERPAFVDLTRDPKEARLVLGPGERKTINLNGHHGAATLVTAPACVKIESFLP